MMVYDSHVRDSTPQSVEKGAATETAQLIETGKEAGGALRGLGLVNVITI